MKRMKHIQKQKIQWSQQIVSDKFKQNFQTSFYKFPTHFQHKNVTTITNGSMQLINLFYILMLN